MTTVAMHTAAAQPPYLDEASVPAAVLDSERALIAGQVADSGKPPAVRAAERLAPALVWRMGLQLDLQLAAEISNHRRHETQPSPCFSASIAKGA